MSRSCRSSSNSTRWTLNVTSARGARPTSRACESLESLRDQTFDGQRAALLIAPSPLLQIFCNDVSLDVDRVARLERTQVCHLDGVRNNGYRQTQVFQLCDRKTDALDRNRALEHDIFLEIFRNVDEQPEIVSIRNGLKSDEAPGSVNVSLHHVSAHPTVGLQWQLEVDLCTLGDSGERRARPGFRSKISAERFGFDVECGQADAADSDAVSLLQFSRGIWRVDGDAVITPAFDDAG